MSIVNTVQASGDSNVRSSSRKLATVSFGSMRAQKWLLPLACGVLISGCSVKRMGLERMADAVSATATAYARDNDPEFVRPAAPPTLKMVEMLLDQQPDAPGLLLTACSGFTQYAYAFLQVDAE